MVLSRVEHLAEDLWLLRWLISMNQILLVLHIQVVALVSFGFVVVRERLLLLFVDLCSGLLLV